MYDDITVTKKDLYAKSPNARFGSEKRIFFLEVHVR